jgi:methanogenic corrinoid protein MtbC1
MGSYSRGDTARQSDGVAGGAELWSSFGPDQNGALDSEKIILPGQAQADPGVELLARAIQQEIIPRLMLVHSKAIPKALATKRSPASIGKNEVQDFVHLLLGAPELPVFTALQVFRQNGMPVESIYLDLLAPSARLLGEYWTEDICDFTEVTVALGRLQRMLNQLSHESGRHKQPVDAGLSILLAPAPGEQHTLGLAMVGELFRNAGWEVCGGPNATTADAVTLVKKRRFDAIGFSLAFEGRLDALAQSILSVRRVAGSSPQCIIVGGPVFVSHPEYVSRVQADLVVANGNDAPELVRHFVLANRVCG